MLSKKPTRNDRFVKTFVKECVCGVVINEINHRHNAFAIHIRRCVKAINSKRIHKCEGLRKENINDGNNELIMETNLVKEQTFEFETNTNHDYDEWERLFNNDDYYYGATTGKTS